MILASKLRERLEILDRCEAEVPFRAVCRARSKQDICFWINSFALTFDPRLAPKPAKIPFILFPKQEEYLRWRRERRQKRESGILEKSRDVGATWLNCADQLHCWLFESGYKGTFGSRKEQLVDRKGDPDCIFEKLRYILYNLPWWMRPDKISDNYLRIINEVNEAAITGEGGDNMGRGGRSSVYDIDEAAFIEHPQSVDAAVSQNSDVIFYTSTPNGLGNPFYQKRQGGNYPVFTLFWRDDPRKGDAWYAKMVAQLDPVIIAQEINIDYSASQEGICIPAAWVQAAIDLEMTEYDGEPLIGGLDVANSGANKNVLLFARGCIVKAEWIFSWSGIDTNQTSFKAKELCHEYKVAHLNYDCVGVGAGVGGTLANDYNLKFSVSGINGGWKPSAASWEEFDNQKSTELFKNLRAELWWGLRRRFEKARDYISGERDYDPVELISIPNHQQLIADLSRPQRKFDNTGKILIESKQDMAKRNVPSPDFADALCYALAPDLAVGNIVAKKLALLNLG